jgi:flagellar FliL protein
MAEESAKEESKEKLKFFKTAKDNPAEAAKPEQQEAAQTGRNGSPQPAEKEVRPSDVTPVGPEPPEPRDEKVRTPIMPLLAPTIALAVRTLVILAVIIADAYAAYFLVVKGIAPGMVEAQVARARALAAAPKKPAAAEPKKVTEAEESWAGTITPIEDIVVNPSGSGGTRYLCTTVAFESIEPAVSEEIVNREPQIRDVLIEILGRRTVEDLSALATREALRDEMKVAVNDLLSSGEVVGVYFSNFVLQ